MNDKPVMSLGVQELLELARQLREMGARSVSLDEHGRISKIDFAEAPQEPTPVKQPEMEKPEPRQEELFELPDELNPALLDEQMEAIHGLKDSDPEAYDRIMYASST